jgi:hypothetical protein
MVVERRFGFIDLVLLLLIVAGAAGVRAWYLSAYANNGQTDGPWQVQDSPPRVAVELPAGADLNGKTDPNEQDALVHNLKQHKWFGSLAPLSAGEEQTAHTSPGYPWLRYWLSEIPGLSFDDTKLRWLQAGLGALTAGLYFLFALRAFQSRLVAILAGLLCAVHPFWIIATAELTDAALAAFLLAACIYLGARAGQSGGALTSLLYGLALAGLALVRAAFLPFAFVALIWFLARSRHVQRGWLCALLALLGFANGLAPWTLRNWQVFHDVIPIVDSTFLHLWIGNHAQATGGPLPVDSQASSDPVLAQRLRQAREGDPAAQPDEAWLKELSSKPQNERYMGLGRDVWNEIKTHPGATLDRRLWAGLYFFFGADFFGRNHALWRWSPDRGEADIQDEWLRRGFYSILRLALLVMLVLGVLGWRWTYGWRYLAMPSSLAVIWVPLPYLLSHAESLAGPRLPLDGVLLTYAAFALVYLIPGVGSVLVAGEDVEPEAARGPAGQPAPIPAPPPPKEKPAAAYAGPRNPFA